MTYFYFNTFIFISSSLLLALFLAYFWIKTKNLFYKRNSKKRFMWSNTWDCCNKKKFYTMTHFSRNTYNNSNSIIYPKINFVLLIIIFSHICFAILLINYYVFYFKKIVDNFSLIKWYKKADFSYNISIIDSQCLPDSNSSNKE